MSSNFMVGAQTISLANAGFSAGLTAKIKVIPAGFVYQTIISLGQGINSALWSWGTFLLNNPETPKQRTSLTADKILDALGYWTEYVHTSCYVGS
jgi:hypothetical protein